MCWHKWKKKKRKIIVNLFDDNRQYHWLSLRNVKQLQKKKKHWRKATLRNFCIRIVVPKTKDFSWIVFVYFMSVEQIKGAKHARKMVSLLSVRYFLHAIFECKGEKNDRRFSFFLYFVASNICSSSFFLLLFVLLHFAIFKFDNSFAPFFEWPSISLPTNWSIIMYCVICGLKNVFFVLNASFYVLFFFFFW